MRKIVQIRGGSGSGKSTLVRRWLEEQTHVQRYDMEHAAAGSLVHIDCAASRPFALQATDKRVIVPGHYDAPGGGCDMIKSTVHIYDVVEKAVHWKQNVLMEGLFVSKDTKDFKSFLHKIEKKDYAVYVILLDTTEEAAYEDVQKRREANGRERRVLRAHAGDWRSVHVSNQKHYEQLASRFPNLQFETLNREQAAARVRELLP